MPNLQCPNCYVFEYRTYANGTVETGYCTRCATETRTATTKKDPVPVIHIEKPKSNQPRIKRK